MLRFDDRVVMITGAGRGIGRSHALYLAARGAKVVVNDYGGNLRGEGGNNPGPADSVVAEIRAAGGTAIAACCDIGDAEQVRSMMDTTLAQFGRIDVVVHNASVFAELGPFAQARVEDLDRLIRVNVNGGWNVAHAAWPSMIDQGYGRIVMTGSGAGFFGRRKDHAYSVAKSALIALTKVLATEGETYGIRANLVGPIAWTDNSQLTGIPSIMEKVAQPVMVSHLVAVLAHADCPVNGEMFRCGGGFVSRVFVGETQGAVFTAETMSAESVLAAMGGILDTDRFLIAPNSDRAGAHVSARIASANPEFAAALAAAKAKRPRAP
jgi:Dehydrogenases with different specificities (related to short-chain alcohol dehydrogenases)